MNMRQKGFMEQKIRLHKTEKNFLFNKFVL